MRVKDIRRVESEIDNELEFIQSRLRNKPKYSTSSQARDAGTSLTKSFLEKYGKLIDAKFELRRLIANFNKTAGINDRTARIAQLEMTKETIDNCLVNYGDVDTYRNYGSDTVKYQAGISELAVDEYRAQSRRLKRLIQSLKDSCNGINAQGTVEVSDDTMELLKESGFID